MELFETQGARETYNLGRNLGLSLRRNTGRSTSLLYSNEVREWKDDRAKVFALYGELGSGKTTFVKGLARGLGIKETITSPTYVFVRSYAAKQGLTLYHLDLYRLDSRDRTALANLDLETILADPLGVVVAEWAEKIENRLRQPSVKVYFEYRPTGRIIRVV